MAANSYDHDYCQDEEATTSSKRTRTGFRCAVAECSGTHADGLSLHKFPQEPSMKKQWINFVTTCRADFGPTYNTPNKNSRICSRHFTPECYPASYALSESFGLSVKKKHLQPWAVPTIQKHAFSTRTRPVSADKGKTAASSCTAVTVAVSHSTASFTITTCSIISSQTTTCNTVTTVASTLRSPVSSIPTLSVSRVRGAYAKRERKRVLDELLNTSDHQSQSETEAMDVTPSSSTPNVPKSDEQYINFDSLSQNQNDDVVESSAIQERTKICKRKNRKIQVYPTFQHKGIQVSSPHSEQQSKGIQCNLDLDSSYEPTNPIAPDSPSAPLNVSFEEQDPVLAESEYRPSSEESESGDDVNECSSSGKKDRVFLIFESCLLELFQACKSCGGQAHSAVKHVAGSMVTVEQECLTCHTEHTWKSQPFIRDIPAGNLLMSSAILFSGSLPSKVFRFFRHMNVPAISDNTFFAHQRSVLHPTIKNVWSRFQQYYVNTAQVQNHSLTLGGDGRADTPGHSAKFGTYSLMDLDLMKVVDVRLVQSNEAGNSARMEKEGFLQSLNFICSHNLIIKEFVSDRHPQIVKYMREEMAGTRHSIDVWHVSKGLKKKLVKLAKEKECEILHDWIRSIINHLYWIPVSVPGYSTEDSQLKGELWASLANHLHNVHQHSGNRFPACQHPPLVGHERKKKWIKEGSKLSVKLCEILESRQILKDIPMLSTGPQTAALEGFHSVLNHFAPKMIGFQYEGLLHRCILAAMHFNENTNRQQAETRDGKQRFKLGFRKAKKDFSLQQVTVDCTYGYVDSLMKAVFDRASNASIREMDETIRLHRTTHLPLSSDYTRPDLEQAISVFKSRYK